MGGLSSGPATNALVLFSSTSLLSPRNHFRRVLVREPCLDWALCRGLLKGWAGWGQCWKPKGTGSHHLIGDFSKAFFFFSEESLCLSIVIPLPTATPTKPSYGFPRPILHLAKASFLEEKPSSALQGWLPTREAWLRQLSSRRKCTSKSPTLLHLRHTSRQGKAMCPGAAAATAWLSVHLQFIDWGSPWKHRTQVSPMVFVKVPSPPIASSPVPRAFSSLRGIVPMVLRSISCHWHKEISQTRESD